MSIEVPCLQFFYIDIFNFTMAPGFDDPVRLFPRRMICLESLSAVGRDTTAQELLGSSSQRGNTLQAVLQAETFTSINV